jgi:hypothetical protein
MVPPLIQFMGSHPDVKTSDFETVRLINSGAAPIGCNDVERLLKRAPHVLFVQGTFHQLLKNEIYYYLKIQYLEYMTWLESNTG